MENTMNIEAASILSLEQYINTARQYMEDDPYIACKMDGVREALELLGIRLVENEHGYIECVRVF